MIGRALRWLRRWIPRVLGGLLVLVGLAVAYVLLFLPRSEPPSDLVIQGSTEQVERGRYLVEHVAYCLDCHSERDWSRYAGPIVARTKGGGARLDFLDAEVW